MSRLPNIDELYGKKEYTQVCVLLENEHINNTDNYAEMYSFCLYKCAIEKTNHGDLDSAIKDLETLIKFGFEPHLNFAYLQLGKCYLVQAKSDNNAENSRVKYIRASNNFTQVITNLSGVNNGAWNIFGSALYHYALAKLALEEVEQAVVNLDNLIGHKDACKDYLGLAYQLRGKIKFTQNKFNEAISDFNLAIPYVPKQEWWRIDFNCAIALRMIGKDKEATGIFKTVLEKSDPFNEELIKIEDHLGNPEEKIDVQYLEQLKSTLMLIYSLKKLIYRDKKDSANMRWLTFWLMVVELRKKNNKNAIQYIIKVLRNTAENRIFYKVQTWSSLKQDRKFIDLVNTCEQPSTNNPGHGVCSMDL